MRRSRSILLVVVCALLTAAVAVPLQPPGNARAAETRDLVVLGTSDIHGNVDNYDYFTDSVPTGSSERGLTKIQTYVDNVRAANPNTIVIDNGDTIQGNPLAYYFDILDTSVENPLAAAMNAIGFVSSTVGNHEFNYGPIGLRQVPERGELPAPLRQRHRVP